MIALAAALVLHAAAASPSSVELLPLEVGRTWTYRQSLYPPSGSPPADVTIVRRVVARETLRVAGKDRDLFRIETGWGAGCAPASGLIGRVWAERDGATWALWQEGRGPGGFVSAGRLPAVAGSGGALALSSEPLDVPGAGKVTGVRASSGGAAVHLAPGVGIVRDEPRLDPLAGGPRLWGGGAPRSVGDPWELVSTSVQPVPPQPSAPAPADDLYPLAVGDRWEWEQQQDMTAIPTLDGKGVAHTVRSVTGTRTATLGGRQVTAFVLTTRSWEGTHPNVQTQTALVVVEPDEVRLYDATTSAPLGRFPRTRPTTPVYLIDGLPRWVKDTTFPLPGGGTAPAVSFVVTWRHDDGEGNETTVLAPGIGLVGEDSQSGAEMRAVEPGSPRLVSFKTTARSAP